MADREPLLEIIESDASPVTEGRIDRENFEDGAPQLQDLKTIAILKAQGHKTEMERSFSLFSAIGLGFRYIACLVEVLTRQSHHH